MPPAFWKARNFSIFWAAQAISRFGDPITLVVLAYVAYVRTGSALVTAIAVVITTVPSALFGLAGGSVADVLGFRRTMVIADASRAILVASLPLLVAFNAPLGVLLTIAFLAAVAGAAFGPARFALVPAVLAPQHLGAGNALLVSTDRTFEILGSLAAGALVLAIGPGAFYVDAATFAISALLLSRLRLDEHPVGAGRPALIAGALEGARFIRGSATLFANTVFSLLAQLSVPVANGLTPVLLIRKFAAGNAEIGAAQFALAEATLAAGAVAGALVIQPLARRNRKGHLLIAGFGSYGALLIGLALAPSFETSLPLFVAIGVANVLSYVPNVTATQELTPPALRGRVIGTRIALLNLSWLPAIVLVGALADRYPVALLIALAGVFTAAVTAAGALLPVVRELP